MPSPPPAPPCRMHTGRSSAGSPPRSAATHCARLAATALLLSLLCACGLGPPELPPLPEGPLERRLEAVRENSVYTDRAVRIWNRQCVACHGAAGGGGVGPNLTDRYWLHGAAPEAIRRSIAKGFPLEGMMAYEDYLSPAEIDALVVYVLDMQGTDPPDAKPPQGEPVE